MVNYTRRAGLVLSGVLFLACGSGPAPAVPAAPAPAAGISLEDAARERTASLSSI